MSALRLSEKGYKVAVIEKGRWFSSGDFPKTNMQLKKWLWLPRLNFFGFFKLTFLRHIGILSGVGVGGGSLVYANTLPVPKDAFYHTGSWHNLLDWEKELKPYYALARRMLGATAVPKVFDADKALYEVARDINREKQFELPEVAVYFGKPGEETEDPYFNGDGPPRKGCIYCGACMTGCRHDAKNTLDKNYLYLAQALGAEIIAEQEVIDVLHNGKSYEVITRNSIKKKSQKHGYDTKGVIFSGGVLGTVKLLHKLKKSSLPNLSNCIGQDVRTNNESLIGVPSLDKERNFSEGVAIGSLVHTDADSHWEAVRYGKGSTFWKFLMLPQTKGSNIISRIGNLFLTVLKNPLRHLRILFLRDFGNKSPILLFMQDVESRISLEPGTLGLKSKVNKESKPKADLPEAKDLANKYARKVNGEPYVTPTESLLGIPTTAHILGGAVMANSPEKGVIDENNQVFGYDNMYVCDGSMISANPGVNPSLSITAITERAMAQIPNKL